MFSEEQKHANFKRRIARLTLSIKRDLQSILNLKNTSYYAFDPEEIQEYLADIKKYLYLVEASFEWMVTKDDIQGN